MAAKKEKSANEPCAPQKGVNQYLIKFGRACAWSLIGFMILYLVSGYGISKSGTIYQITGGLLHRALSFQIHEYLVLPMVFAFLCHTLIAIRFAMIRWNVQKMKIVDYSFIALGVILFGLTCWIYFV